MTDALGPALMDEVKKRVPAKRLGRVDEIADAGPLFGERLGQLHYRPGNHT